MAGDILIIDNVATNRIVLKVKLLAAQYRVRPCATLQEARTEIAASLPDLIVLDTSIDAHDLHAFCQTLKAGEDTSLIPIIATGGFKTPRDRVVVLEAGADDVLSKPFDDQILQARIRSLLRGRDARQELRMRDGTRTALGFAEACNGFKTPARVVAASTTDTLAPDLSQLSQTLENAQLICARAENLTRSDVNSRSTDLFLLDFRAGLTDDNVLFRILAELRSRSATRHAAILALLPADARHAAAMALDLGASDSVYSNVDSGEIRHRCAVLIQAKHEADALRRTVETGLEAAITDPLTGLFNRRYAMPHLSRLSAQSRKSGRKFAIMVLDLDHFKAINDTYGHKVGDEILRQTASRLQDNLRAVDLLARIGGEEFLVAIPNSDVFHARTAAERLRELIGGAPFFVGPDQKEVRVTMSVGVSLSDGQDPKDMVDDLGELVNAADVALYAAKNGGRNKVSLSAA
ncbi:putative response regulator [Octadecabacter antarcticus 307]|uniref:diguanylate cyclase n=1 Tax=Octadecabacter antarcticus 307 TaxID=391626 RepID=M9R5Q7_9RHOB|nr:diguanylate cyclase [Octadecabacter antarcticus]AGI67113.1 putative response regulator [Octadecabacter antarcticus 307]